ncbi:MAG: hypothetical protein ACRD4B_02275, partial [Acidobacteriota bacterium]
MMNEYFSIPVSTAVFIKDAKEKKQFYENLFLLPATIRKLLFSDKTGAYIRGLARSHHIPEEKVPLIAHG